MTPMAFKAKSYTLDNSTKQKKLRNNIKKPMADRDNDVLR